MISKRGYKQSHVSLNSLNFDLNLRTYCVVVLCLTIKLSGLVAECCKISWMTKGKEINSVMNILDKIFLLS